MGGLPPSTRRCLCPRCLCSSAHRSTKSIGQSALRKCSDSPGHAELWHLWGFSRNHMHPSSLQWRVANALQSSKASWHLAVGAQRQQHHSRGGPCAARYCGNCSDGYCASATHDASRSRGVRHGCGVRCSTESTLEANEEAVLEYQTLLRSQRDAIGHSVLSLLPVVVATLGKW